MEKLSGLFAILGLYVFVPILLARFLTRSTWRQIGQAYGIWLAMLFVLGLALGGGKPEGWGWAFILGMFWTVPAIPILALVLKLQAWMMHRRGHVT